MKVLFIKCPYCEKRFYAETILFENKMPLHCPGCDAYFGYDVYAEQMGSTAASALRQGSKNRSTKRLYLRSSIYRRKTAEGGT